LGLDPGDLPSGTLKSGSLERGQSVAYFLDVAGATEQSYFLDFEKVRPQTIVQREILERIIFTILRSHGRHCGPRLVNEIKVNKS
jgi:hypothetical protein